MNTSNNISPTPEENDATIAYTSMNKISKPWFVYLIECVDKSIYTGATVDVAARFAKHAQGKGARYTKANPPQKILAVFSYPNQSLALKAEYKIKQLSPAEKRKLSILKEYTL